MTREEQIDTAASRRANQFTHPVEWNEAYCRFREGAKWADSHPYWHKAGEELPEKLKLDPNISIRVLALDEDGEYHIAIYDYSVNDWQMVEGNEGAENIFRTVLLIDIIYWMPLPNKPEE